MVDNETPYPHGGQSAGQAGSGGGYQSAAWADFASADPGEVPAAATGYSYPIARTQVDMGEAWTAARIWIKRNPVIFAGLPLWAVVLFAFMFASLSLLELLGRSQDAAMGVAYLVGLLAVLAACAVGVSHACLVAARWERVRVRDFFVFPNPLRSWLVTVITMVLMAAGLPLLGVGAVLAYFFLHFATFVALHERATVPGAIARSVSLMRQGTGTFRMVLACLALVWFALATGIGVIALIPLQVLISAYAYMRLADAFPAQSW